MSARSVPVAAGGILEAAGLAFRYPKAARDAIRRVSVQVRPSSVLAVIGPNGAGKSTLAKLLAGSLEPRSGTTSYDGTPLAEWRPRDLARRVAVVPQREHVAFPLTVRDLAAMGRYPHLGPWRRERAEDASAVLRALQRCEVADLAGRVFQTLSGGEMQRVRLARALAQAPKLLIVDEPTAALDMRYEMTIFRLLRDLADDGLAVMIVTHNLNLATRFSDRMLLLDEGAVAAEGPPGHVVTTDTISRAYRWPVSVVRQSFREGAAPQVAPG